MIRCPESWQLDFQPKLKWDYCHGLELQSMLDVYDRYGNRKIYDYALAYADTMVNADGTIKMYKREEYSLDRINSGKFIFRIYEQTKDEKYKKALALMRSQLDEHPRNADGGFWHKKIYPNQVWLDGIYMGAPFYAEYAFRNNQVDDYADVINQFLMAARHTYDPKNDVYRHACDVSRKERWADPVTGQSKHSWGRAMGWYAMALIDTMEVMPESMACQKARLNAIYKELIDAMLPYQDQATGMWYQVVNRGGIAPNYLEESGSAIFAYAIMKSVRLHYLPEEYFKYGQKAFDGICSTYLSEKDGSLQLGGICLVAGLGNTDMREGTFEYYMREPVVENEAKGIAPLILAYIETMFRCQS